MKKSAKNGQKQQKLMFYGRKKKWFYVIDTIFWHILEKLKKILGTVFSQSLKNPEMTSNLPLTSIFWAKNAQKRPK